MDSFIIAGRQFRSRLIVGTGKYKSGQETATAIESSGAESVDGGAEIEVLRYLPAEIAVWILVFAHKRRFFRTNQERERL